jgi:uncharacterized membrane protein
VVDTSNSRGFYYFLGARGASKMFRGVKSKIKLFFDILHFILVMFFFFGILGFIVLYCILILYDTFFNS